MVDSFSQATLTHRAILAGGEALAVLQIAGVTVAGFAAEG
jgi:hypothetical protein